MLAISAPLFLDHQTTPACGVCLIGGFDPRAGREWVHYEWSAGGNGAFAEDDGPSAMATIDWGDLVTV